MVTMIKVTFTLDEATVAQLRRTAARVRKPQSQVVREAIGEYAARSDRLSEEERRRMLSVLDRVISQPPSRPAAETDAELREIRAARRRWGRRRSAPRPP
jgi:Ribbon-helix-helix protein, copG family